MSMNKASLDEMLNNKEYPLFKSMVNNVVQGDTIAKMKELPDSSVDLLLVDLPYGTTQNKWDSVIPYLICGNNITESSKRMEQ